MYHKNALTRYRLIDARITSKQNHAPTLKDLVDYVSEKLSTPISTSIIQKDIYAMRYDEALGYNAPLEYSLKERGYIYTKEDFSINNIPVSGEDLHGLEMAIGILEQFKNIPAIREFEYAIQKIAVSVKQSRENQNLQNNTLLLDRPKRYAGIEFMTDMVDAIREKKVMKFLYHPFTKQEAKKHTVHPYFIKEYNSRMYLIAKDIHPTKASKFLTFAFDRMSDVLKMNQTFFEESIDVENYFSSTIGVSLPDSKPEKIELSLTPNQSNYIKSQPIHHSQKILKDTKKEIKVQLELVINYELKAMLLSFGNQLKVLKPEALAKEIKNIAKDMLSLYC